MGNGNEHSAAGMRACAQTLLAASNTGRVTVCSCGHVHLALGALTLRLGIDDFLRAATMIDAAATALVSVDEDGVTAEGG